jgi:hypothetical protein
VDEGELLKKGDLEAVLQPRLAPVLKRANRLSELLINQGAIAAASKRGLRPTAIPDLTLNPEISTKQQEFSLWLRHRLRT